MFHATAPVLLAVSCFFSMLVAHGQTRNRAQRPPQAVEQSRSSAHQGASEKGLKTFLNNGQTRSGGIQVFQPIELENGRTFAPAASVFPQHDEDLTDEEFAERMAALDPSGLYYKLGEIRTPPQFQLRVGVGAEVGSASRQFQLHYGVRIMDTIGGHCAIGEGTWDANTLAPGRSSAGSKVDSHECGIDVKLFYYNQLRFSASYAIGGLIPNGDRTTEDEVSYQSIKVIVQRVSNPQHRSEYQLEIGGVRYDVLEGEGVDDFSEDKVVAAIRWSFGFPR